MPLPAAPPAHVATASGPLRAPGVRPLSERGLRAALAYAQRQGCQSLLLEEWGRLRLQHHEAPALATEPRSILSGAKNLWALAALQLAEEGRLDLDAPVSHYLPAWSVDPGKAKVRVRQLLNGTSGLAPGFSELHGQEVGDKYAYASALPLAAPPGERFRYAPSHFEVLGAVFRQVLGAEPSLEYLQRRLLRPLGLRVDAWRLDGTGQPTLFAGVSLTPGDWMKVGRLLLDQGRVGGTSLLSEASLKQAFQRSQSNGAYGLSFWLNGEAPRPGAVEADVETWISDRAETRDWRHACLSRWAPADLVACVGSNGQRLYVVPSRRLVIVHMGRSPRFKDATFLRLLFQG